MLWASPDEPMPVSSEYLTYVSEQLARVPGLRSRRMFGGVGLYGGELFFGLIADNTLFLRVDDGNREDFTRRGMQPFRPFKDRPGQVMAYYEVPPEVIEDAEQLSIWAAGALRAAAVAPRSKSRPRHKAAATPADRGRGAR
jgi:DNA transformation protein